MLVSTTIAVLLYAISRSRTGMVDLVPLAATRCTLPACNTHGPRAPVLFTDVTTDGSGHRLSTILAGIIMAAASGYNYGGALTNMDASRFLGPSQGGLDTDFGVILDGFFGRGARAAMVRCGCCYSEWVRRITPHCVDGSAPAVSGRACPRFDVVLGSNGSSLDGLRQLATTPRPGHAAAAAAPLVVHAALRAHWLPPAPGGDGGAHLLPPALLALLRPPLWARPLVFARAPRPALAMHVRRGDMVAGNARVLPEAYFVTMLQEVRRSWPDVDVHVWSSTLSSARGDQHWGAAHFDALRRHGATVHLDGDLLDAMAHLARADAVVLSESHFGWAPALLNPGCVVRAPRPQCRRGRGAAADACDYTGGALEGWVRGLLPQQMAAADSPPMRALRTDLQACLARVNVGGAQQHEGAH